MAVPSQQQYQVRFAWGRTGAARIGADAHLLVWVDVLPGDVHAAGPRLRNAALRTVTAHLPDGPEVVLGHLGNATAVAERVTRLQAALGDRCVVAIVAAGRDHAGASDVAEDAGEGTDAPDAPDFAVEDLLAAGALVDALAVIGIDHTSPEAAAACAAYSGLRRAVKHLVSASESGAAVGRDAVHGALAAGPELVVLRESGRRA
ncbi:2-phosphosulfolactate phosphatase [Curtobacterium sp. ISL-83]|uniref:2-phosphosulfolactate phosphatase n=1 Tax=Curtobacterium sp. ISL-83 TaxID=2819145 RepID=UPI002035C1BB|nr:2-phosphosulfolactate phosphatase [Curtobacterium sp. ISL-83]